MAAEKPKSNASFYAAFIPPMRELAREHGYALALHGSMVRDLDIVLVPWTHKAGDPVKLIDALMVLTGTFLGRIEADNPYFIAGSPSSKEHGRLVWSLHFTEAYGSGPYIDVSLFPPNKGRSTYDLKRFQKLNKLKNIE